MSRALKRYEIVMDNYRSGRYPKHKRPMEGFLAFYASSNGETQQLQFYPNLIQKVGGTVVVPGDVDGDGAVTAGDVTALYNYILNNDSSSIVNGDQDGDGSITAGDVTFVYNILLGSK